MKELILEEFRALLNQQNVGRDDYAFRCPMCGTVQSPRMLIAAGAEPDFDAVNKIVGFNCIGRVRIPTQTDH
ncbi:hypothetical protein LU631_04410 [Erwinia tracheiphila]|uniref:Uncharacterized protein n=1 Tax=Erwinia tracheiphila TaxID=65700 RepID=A0A0M2KD07_9GAMM|nr:VVA0879 family protein [Erwinia tracheiphila]KKF37245.1 hypothetical protein SY86_20440 [Erwinia tracheiphila]UIA88639.1 hypothetical protein LU631_04410 [Erwinia tracheiphila]UIA97019.1 hypothetical protein LU633_03085 [Erwinia tracheiphila]